MISGSVRPNGEKTGHRHGPEGVFTPGESGCRGTENLLGLGFKLLHCWMVGVLAELCA